MRGKMGRGAGREDLLARVVPGYQSAKIILTACRLRVFDALLDAPLTADETATRLGLDSEATPVLLDALAALGLLRKRAGRYALTRLAKDRLTANGPASLAALFRHQDRMWDDWSGLATRLKPGGPGDEADALRDFVLAMDANARRQATEVTAAVDLRGVREMLDLGGGPGTYARSFLARSPELRVTVFDRPEVVAIARDLPANRDAGQRLTWKTGDFLEGLTGGPWDLIWASHVMHSESASKFEELAPRLLAALRPGGRLVLHDFFLSVDRTSPERAALFSVHMLAVTASGRSPVLAETRDALRAAGFKTIRLAARFGPSALLTARRP